MKSSKIEIAVFTVGLLSASLIFADGGTAIRGGVDERLADVDFVRSLLKNGDLKRSMLSYLETIQLDQLNESTPDKKLTKDALSRMLTGGQLQSDINTSSNYYEASRCVDAGARDVHASAKIGEIGGKICFDVVKLADQYKNISRTEAMKRLAAVALHEHTHHFQNPRTPIAQNEHEAYLISDYVGLTATYAQIPTLIWEPRPATNFLGQSFVVIPVGPAGATFLMGSPANEPGRYEDEVQHSVTLTQSYEMQTTDVTQEQWVKLMGSNPSYFQKREYCPETYRDTPVAMCPTHPVEQVSWEDAQAFITKLNSNTPDDGYFYRLPTEAEWEYAARGCSEDLCRQNAYSFGNNPNMLARYGWFANNSGDQTQAVAQLRPNAFGLYDIHGNVWQWTYDWYDSYSDLERDPVGPSSGSSRVLRGGGWYILARFVRSAYRYNDAPGNRYYFVGFRLARGR